MAKSIAFLQSCIDNLDADNAIRVINRTTLRQSNSEGVATKESSMDEFATLNNRIASASAAQIDGGRDGDIPSLSSLPINTSEGNEITFYSYSTNTLPDGGLPANRPAMAFSPNNYLRTGFILEARTTQGYSTRTAGTQLTLENDNTPPELTISAPAGTYSPGDVIPITIQGNEFIRMPDIASTTLRYDKIKINKNSPVHTYCSQEGKFITIQYVVPEITSTNLTVTLEENAIYDVHHRRGSQAIEKTFDNITIDSPQLRNAPTMLSASYDAANSRITFEINAKNDKEYQQLYASLQDKAIRLSVREGNNAATTLPATLDQEHLDSYIAAFTVDPLTGVSPGTAPKEYTVELQVNEGSSDNENWITLHHLTKTVTVAPQTNVTSVEISVVGGASVDTISLTDENPPRLQAMVNPSNASYTTGQWQSSNTNVATIDNDGQITPKAIGSVSFTFVADNGTEDSTDDVSSNTLTFTVTAGDQLSLLIPQYAQNMMLRAGNAAQIRWITNAHALYPDNPTSITVNVYAGETTGGDPVFSDTVSYTGSASSINQMEVPANELTVTYPRSTYTVEVKMTAPESKTATAALTVLSPPTQVQVAASHTSITDSQSASVTTSISNGAKGKLSVSRVAGDSGAAVTANDCISGNTFTPKKVGAEDLYDTYTITYTEDISNLPAMPDYAASTDSVVIYVYKADALQIVDSTGTAANSITLSNADKVNGAPITDSKKILALRQELGLIEYISINADEHQWNSFRDGIKWLSSQPEQLGVYYRQGGLWDNITDLKYETYLPQTQMALSSTTDISNVTITATHAATGMQDQVTVEAKTLKDQFYLFQVSPARETTVTYTTKKNAQKQVQTNADGLLALYEPDGIASDVYFRSGTETDPYLGSLPQSALASGERDAAKLYLYPLNTATLRPAARAELFLVKPDGSPLADTDVTLRGGVYLGGGYCEEAKIGASAGQLQPGNVDLLHRTDENGKLTIFMDASQFESDAYDGPLTNAALDYWFEVRTEDYFPMLVNVQGVMSANRILRTASSIVTLKEAGGVKGQPFLTAQTLSYGANTASDERRERNVLGSTGSIGPNSSFKYAELTSHFMLWGLDTADGEASVSMTDESGYAPEGQTVTSDTFPFASIPVITNRMVLTKATMTESGWLKPETPANLRASIYQDGKLVQNVSMPFRVIDLTDVKAVSEDARAVMLEMQDSVTMQDSQFNFSGNSQDKVTSAFAPNIASMLGNLGGTPGFKVLITPSEDSTVFNAVIWGGYNSLGLDDFEYSGDGVSMDHDFMQGELNLGAPGVDELGQMATGTYDPRETLGQNKLSRGNTNLNIGAQLEGYYEGQFYYDTDLKKWAFRTLNGGFTAGVGISFQANVNVQAGPVPLTASFGAGLTLQLGFKSATVFRDQLSAEELANWNNDALRQQSVNDLLTTLRIAGYIEAFGGIGVDYTIIALKVGLFGKLSADSHNQFLTRNYLAANTQLNGSALEITGEVGIKFVAKVLFFSYEAVLASGSITYATSFGNYKSINDYWTGAGHRSLPYGLIRMESRSYLLSAAPRTWTPRAFNNNAIVVQDNANPSASPVVNHDGSLAAYISDVSSTDYYKSRIYAGTPGMEGAPINNGGYGDMSPSLAGTGTLTAAAWVRLHDTITKNADEPITAEEQSQLMNSTEVWAATHSGSTWTAKRLTENAAPDLAPVTASNGQDKAAVFWRSTYSSAKEQPFAFDTQDALYYSGYSAGDWSEPQMIYNGSSGGVIGLQTAMLTDGTAIAVFALDRSSEQTKDYQIAYCVIAADGKASDMVVLTDSDSAIADTQVNPQVIAVSDDGTPYFIIGWYTDRDGGDIRLQSVSKEGALYNAGSPYAVPASLNEIAGDDGSRIGAEFRFAQQTPNTSSEKLTLVWAETVTDTEGDADHSNLYASRLFRTGNSVRLSVPHKTITLPTRTQANSFGVWVNGNAVSALIHGTYYDPNSTESI